MDLAQLRAADIAARTCTIEVGAARFTVVLPKQSELAALSAGLADGEPAAQQLVDLAHRMLLRAVTGWEGVTAGDIVPGLAPDQAAEPVAFEPGALAMLLEETTPASVGLLTEFKRRFVERQEALGILRKN